MSQAHVCDTKVIFHQSDNLLHFRLSRIKDTEDFFITEINGKEKIIQTLSKYITALDYGDKTLLVLSGASNDASLCSFTTVICRPVGIASASISLVFLISSEIVKMFLETVIRRKKYKSRKITFLARSKLNNVEKR